MLTVPSFASTMTLPPARATAKLPSFCAGAIVNLSILTTTPLVVLMATPLSFPSSTDLLLYVSFEPGLMMSEVPEVVIEADESDESCSLSPSKSAVERFTPEPLTVPLFVTNNIAPCMSAEMAESGNTTAIIKANRLLTRDLLIALLIVNAVTNSRQQIFFRGLKLALPFSPMTIVTKKQ